MARHPPPPLLVALIGAAIALPASGQTPTPSSEALAPVFACADRPSPERLACYDREVARLRTAVGAREVTVVDRAQAATARREAFGFRLPSLSMLNGLAGGEEPASARFVLAKAGRDGDRWRFETTDGPVWRTTEAVGFMRIRDGATAEVRRGALGAFFMKIDGGRAFKVERVR